MQIGQQRTNLYYGVHAVAAYTLASTVSTKITSALAIAATKLLLPPLAKGITMVIIFFFAKLTYLVGGDVPRVHIRPHFGKLLR